jgi:hypothetical protein
MTKAQNKTVATGGVREVEDFIAALPEKRRAEARVLDALFRKVTGFQPRLWGGSMIGYGQYHYVYDSGREGDFLATGFRPAKARHSIYIMPGYEPYADIAARLGKHKAGKSCWYVNKLDDIDLNVLGELVTRGLADLNRKWPVVAG